MDRPGKPMEKRSQCHPFRRPLKRLYNKFSQKTSPCKPLAGGLRRPEVDAYGVAPTIYDISTAA